MKTLKVRQSDITRATGYKKATMSELASGKQRYNRDILNEVADALHIRPYELLMHPDEAMAIRRVRESAVRIAAGGIPPVRKSRTSTREDPGPRREGASRNAVRLTRTFLHPPID
jgi:transcriptional regulator with XRE-family HTH domain